MSDIQELLSAQPRPSASPGGSVGTRVLEERLRLQLTQVEMAEKLGISRTSVALYESGKHLPRADVLIGFDGLGADVLYILTGRRDTDAVDLNVLAFAMEEVRQQTSQSAQVVSYRELLHRAWPIYLALMNFQRRSLDKLKSPVPEQIL